MQMEVNHIQSANQLFELLMVVISYPESHAVVVVLLFC